MQSVFLTFPLCQIWNVFQHFARVLLLIQRWNRDYIITQWVSSVWGHLPVFLEFLLCSLIEVSLVFISILGLLNIPWAILELVPDPYLRLLIVIKNSAFILNSLHSDNGVLTKIDSLISTSPNKGTNVPREQIVNCNSMVLHMVVSPCKICWQCGASLKSYLWEKVYIRFWLFYKFCRMVVFF